MIDPSMFDSGIFPLLLLLIITVIVFKIIKSVLEWRHNNKQPILTVNAKVISKRTKSSRKTVKQHHDSTDYYGTFELENGEKIEFLLTRSEFELIAEEEVGKLTYQGTRFNHFH